MSEHWCLVELDCLLNAIPSVQICDLDVPAASDGNNIKKNRRKEKVKEEEEERGTCVLNEH
jgi:hypothetical protein